MRSTLMVISGGQTWADRAGLDAARACGLPTGGHAPSHYWTERGPDPSLKALGLQNVLDADATVIFQTHPSPGSALTAALARCHGKPTLVVNPWYPEAAAKLRAFLAAHRPGIVNVAGHRESNAPGIYQQVFALLSAVFRETSND